MNEYEKTGYLNSNFKIFHLSDEGMSPIGFHFHDFHKILLLTRGNVSYCVEGRTYDLQANDIVFVPAGEVHRPILHDTGVYERIIIYISKDYLDTYRTADYDLSQCLVEAHQKQSHVLRVPAFGTTKLGQIVRELEQSLDSREYANELYHNLLFLEFMIQLNRVAIHDGIEYLSNSSSNKKMIDIIDYLNEHLTDDLSIDFLAETFYLSRYHLMHAFKEETGYTIGNYLSTKRLLLARSLIQKGEPITSVCYECGFRNYSTFSRAYKKSFGCSPREQLNQLPPSY